MNDISFDWGKAQREDTGLLFRGKSCKSKAWWSTNNSATLTLWRYNTQRVQTYVYYTLYNNNNKLYMLERMGFIIKIIKISCLTVSGGLSSRKIIKINEWEWRTKDISNFLLIFILQFCCGKHNLCTNAFCYFFQSTTFGGSRLMSFH